MLVEPIYIRDWWHPLTITGTKIGIEDFLFGFLLAGIASVIYEEVFKKQLLPRKVDCRKADEYGLFTIFSLALLFFVGFVFLRLTSFWSSALGFLAVILFIWSQRPDLIIDSLVSGAMLLTIGFLWFWLPAIVTPGWVENYWYLDKLSGVVILGAPMEDLIWGFLAGAYIGPLYEFWKCERLKNIRQ